MEVDLDLGRTWPTGRVWSRPAVVALCCNGTAPKQRVSPRWLWAALGTAARGLLQRRDKRKELKWGKKELGSSCQVEHEQRTRGMEVFFEHEESAT